MPGNATDTPVAPAVKRRKSSPINRCSTAETKTATLKSNSQPSNTCALCLDNMNGTPLRRNVVALVPCGHVFHEDCHAGLRASVLQRDPDEDDDEDDDLPEDRPVKCPSCYQETQNFVRLFLHLAEPSTMTCATTSNYKKATLEQLVRNDLLSPHVDTVEFAMKRIKNELLDKEMNSFLLLGGHVVVLRAMERFASVKKIQFQGGRILLALVVATADDSNKHRTVLNASAAYKTLLTAMRLHPKQPSLLALSCAVLTLLCGTRADVKQIIGDEGIRLVLQALKRFPGQDIAPRVCGFLRAVACNNEENIELLAHQDGIGVLVQSMNNACRKPKFNPRVVFGELAAASVSTKREIILRGGVTAIPAALEKYHRLVNTWTSDDSSMEVQRYAQIAMQIICGVTTCTTTTTPTATTATAAAGNSTS